MKETNEYRDQYNNVCDRLMAVSVKLQSRLEVIDVAGALVAVSCETLKRNDWSREEVGEWLHTIADAVTTGEIGFERKLN